jgi:hypothetical protein
MVNFCFLGVELPPRKQFFLINFTITLTKVNKCSNSGMNIGTPKSKNKQQKSIKFTKENL